MKLLINGKPRNIYFRKDKTVYYKNNRIENDITFYFKKSGELKKQYSNILIEKNRKKITGGAKFNAFGDITIEADINPENEWDNKTIKEIYEKLLQIFMLAKIQMDNNTMLFDPNINTTESTKIKLIKALQIIAGIYEPLDSTITNIIPQTNNLTNTEAFTGTITNLKKNTVFNDTQQLELDKSFIELNKLETFNDNEISALFTQANKTKYDTNPIKLNIDIIDDATILRIKKDILDIVSYDRIVIKLEILKDTDNIDYYTRNLKNLKKLMLDAKLFDETDVLPIDSSIVSSMVPNVTVDNISSLANLNDKTNQIVNNSTINTMVPNVTVDKISSLDNLNDKTNQLVNNSTINTMVPNVTVDKLSSLANSNNKTNQLVNNSTINTMVPNVNVDKIGSLDSTVQKLQQKNPMLPLPKIRGALQQKPIENEEKKKARKARAVKKRQIEEKEARKAKARAVQKRQIEEEAKEAKIKAKRIKKEQELEEREEKEEEEEAKAERLAKEQAKEAEVRQAMEKAEAERLAKEQAKEAERLAKEEENKQFEKQQAILKELLKGLKPPR